MTLTLGDIGVLAAIATTLAGLAGWIIKNMIMPRIDTLNKAVSDNFTQDETRYNGLGHRIEVSEKEQRLLVERTETKVRQELQFGLEALRTSAALQYDKFNASQLDNATRFATKEEFKDVQKDLKEIKQSMDTHYKELIRIITPLTNK